VVLYLYLIYIFHREKKRTRERERIEEGRRLESEGEGMGWRYTAQHPLQKRHLERSMAGNKREEKAIVFGGLTN